MAAKVEEDRIDEYFTELADLLDSEREPHEQFLLNLHGEATDFTRFNRNSVRQAGHVRQLEIEVDLVEGEQHASAQLNVTGDLSKDWQSLNSALHKLREIRASVGPDPHLLFNTAPYCSRRHHRGTLPKPGAAATHIIGAADGLDLVGILASGSTYRGFANHLGQRNWFAADSFNFDWSCYAHADKAVKARYAGSRWRDEDIDECMQQARELLMLMKRAPRKLTPGRYRAYFSPAALAEILGMLAWGGFELKSHRCHTTPLLKLAAGERNLNPLVTIRENNARGFAPDFTAQGFLKPEQVALIEKGRYAEHLCDARQAREYGENVNADNGFPVSLDMAPGELSQDQVLNVLGTGLYIGNLWYCNYSDRTDCRVTGMTRFATFWVEDGQIASPTEVMRFDDSIYDLLGDNLVALTLERELIMDASSYHCRSSVSTRVPGAIVDDLKLTL